MSGHVRDETGAVLPGVSVELLEIPGRRAVGSVVTDTSGYYRVTVPRVGSYQVRFLLINFGSITKDLTVAEPLTVDVSMSLAFSADVTVTGHRSFRNVAEVENPTESLIGLANAASEGAITARQLEHRPLLRPGEVLETVPGLVVSQHSGEGKANQYYLRGFNLDHGTDFAVSVAGVPVNMPTHGHGQGWSDVNFLIPELVSGVQFRKGPYYSEEGNFSTAGAANINYVNLLDHAIGRITTGGDGFGRVLAAASPRVGPGHLLVAFESGRNDGPWDTPERYRRLNTVVRYTQGNTQRAVALTAMAYRATWDATDQVPRRAIASRLISPFGSLDTSDGGKTHRYTMSAEFQRSTMTSTTKWSGYAIDSGLDLFSNFTFALNDPINGDQFEQVDNRRVAGFRVAHHQRSSWFGRSFEHSAGAQLRHDWIDQLGLYSTQRRQRLSTTREDAVHEGSLGLHYQAEVELTDRLRATSGIRADLYRFSVQSLRPDNSGTDIAAIVNPKLGVAFAPSRRLELYANLGYGHHSNDARGVTITIDPTTGLPADRVRPLVRTRGEELGVRAILVPRLQTTIAVWGLSLDSELVFVGDAGTTEPGRPSRRMGIEWANYYSPTPWLSFDADLSWSKAHFTDGDPTGPEVPGAVRHVASVGMSVINRARLSGGIRVRYLGPRKLIEDGTVSSSRSLIVNGESSVQLRPGLQLVVDALNMFDARDSDIEYFYRSRLPGEPSDGVEDVHTHPLQPRTFRVGLRLGF